MNVRAPGSRAVPAAAAAKMSTGKIVGIVGAVVCVVAVLFLGAVAIALGVGLGVGLRKTNSTQSKLSGPVVNCNPSISTCGCQSTKPTFSSRIINGDITTINNWPWMVIVQTLRNTTCSGFLITNQHVLTAASCLYSTPGNVTVFIGVNSYSASAGVYNVTNTSNVGDTIVDIAVIILGVKLNFSTTIQPCCLTRGGDTTVPQVNDRGVIAGWGEISTTSIGVIPGPLRQAVVQVRSPTTCGLQSTSEFCGSYDSIGACPIDAGGPFMVSYNNAWTCVGVIAGRQTTCDDTITFTRVANYYAYIQNITGYLP